MASPSTEDSSPINSVFLDRFPKMACSGDSHPHPAPVFPGVPPVLCIACFISGALCPLSFVCFYFLLSNCSVRSWRYPGGHPFALSLSLFLALLFSALLPLVSAGLAKTLKPSSLATLSPGSWGLSPSYFPCLPPQCACKSQG